MRTNDFNKTISDHKMIVDLIEHAGNYVVSNYQAARENGLINDFILDISFHDNEALLIVFTEYKEVKSSIYDFPFQFFISIKGEKLLCKISCYTEQKEALLDICPDNKEQIISFISFSLLTIEDKLNLSGIKNNHLNHLR